MCTGVTEAPSNGVTLDPVVWAIIGFAAGVTLTAALCFLLIICCYCSCFSAGKAKRTKYSVQKGMAVLAMSKSKHTVLS